MKNSIAKKARNFLFDPKARFNYLVSLGVYDRMDDVEFLKKKFRLSMGRDLDLETPRTFNEKLQWLKLYDRRPEYTTMADKYAVKQFAAERIGKEHVLPALGVWDRFEDIDFDALPDQFVLKCTHDSGGFVICRDKASFDRAAARKRIEKRLGHNYYMDNREWVYKDIPPRILAEPYIDSLGKPDSVEYKCTCFDGVVKVVTVCTGIAHVELSRRTNDNFDRELRPQNWYAFYKNSGKTIEFPSQIHQIIAFAEKFSEGIPQVRVDFYLHNDNVYFGEMTFYTWAGFIEFEPPEWDEVMGGWIRLPDRKEL